MSDVLVSHAFVSPKGASSDPTKIDGPKWNAALVHAGGSDGDVAVRDSASTVGASWGTRTEPLHINTTQTGTIANTTETDLWSWPLPAGKLNANGRTIRLRAYGTVGANGNAKTIRVYFGATVLQIYSAGTANGVAWMFDGDVSRLGASSQQGIGKFLIGSTHTNNVLSAPAESTAGAITIKITGQNGTASANDVVFRGVTVELL